MSHDQRRGIGWRRVVVACVVGGALYGVPASAQVTWDANTGTTGPQDGSGTWSTSDANWWNGTTDVVWPNLTTSSAIIGANSGAAGTITAAETLSLNAITFNAAGSGTYTVTGGTLGFAGTSPTITANAAATIASTITSGAGLTKSGTGTLTLSGSLSNTAGGMSINRGAVTLTGTLTNTASSGFTIGGTNGGSLTIAGGSMSTSWSNARAIVIAGGANQSGTLAISSGDLSASGMLISEDSGGNGVFTQSGGTVSIGSGNLWIGGNTSSLTVSGGSFTNNNTTYFASGSPNPSTSTISVSGSGSITLNTLNWGAFSRNGFTATLNVGDGTSGGTFQVNNIASGATSVASTMNFDGGTFVANGTFAMPAQISPVVKAGGANISVANAQALTLGSPLTDGGGGGGLRKLGTGTLSLTGANTYTGATSIAAGSLSIGNALALQNSTLDLDASDTGTVSAIGQNSTLGGLTGSRNLDMLTRTLSIGNNNASTTYSGTLSNGAVRKIGSGTLTLTGASSYTGGTTIDAGVLQIGNGGTTGSLSTSSAISGSAGAGLAFSRTDNYGGNVSNDIGGGIGLTLNSGTLALTGSNTFSGTTRINGGVLSLGSANALAGAGDVTFAGGTLQFTASNSEDFASRIKDSGSAIAIDTNGQNRTFAGSIDSSNTAGLVKSGAGTLVLSGANTFSGGVTLTGGQVQIANSSGLGTGTFTTNVDANTTIPFNLSTSGTVANDITINKPGANRSYYFQQNQANNLTLAGDITVASGNATHFTLAGVSAGTYTLTGSNTFGADVYPGAGVTMRIGGTGAAGTGVWRPNLAANIVLLDGANFGAIIGNAIASYSMETAGTATVSRDIFNRDSANVAVNLPAGAQLTFSATLRAEGGSTTGTYTKTGAGTWVVNNTANQMTFNVQEGTMQVASFAALGPSSTGVFVFLGSAGKTGTLSYTGATASTSKPFTATAGGTAAFAVTSAATTVTLSGLIDGGGDVSFGGPGSYVLSGGISAANVIKTGTGSATLSVGNSQANTTVSAGQLNVNHLAALGTPAGTLTMASGTSLDNTSGAAVTVTNPKSIALGSSLTFVGSNDLDLGTGNVTLSGDTEFNIAAGELTLSGDVLGAGFGITKTGTGTLRLDGLTGSSSFTGNSFVNAGTLLLEGSSILGGGTSTVVTVADGAFLQIGASAGLGDVTVVSRPAGIITATVVNANQTFDQSGTLTTSNANFNGVQTIESGVTITTGHNYLGTIPATTTAGRIVFQDNAKIRVTAGFELDAKQGISLQSGTAIFESDANQALLIPASVAGSGGIRKIGAGNMRLTGSNTYSGGTVIEEGIIGISYGESLGDVSGRLKLDGGTIVAAQVLSGGTISTVTIDSGRSFVLANGKTGGIDAQTGLTLRYDGVISEENGGGAAAGLRVGSGSARQGTVILGGANTYRGDTTISYGTLKLASGGSFADSARIIVGGSGSSGVALDLTEKSSFSIGSSQVLMGGGKVNLGATTVLTVQGTFAPGNSPGLFTYSSGTTVLSGTTVMEIFGTSRATAASHGSGFYDAVNVVDNGVLEFGGILTFEFSSLFDDDSMFDLFSPASGSSLTGNFTGVNVQGSFYTGLSWSQVGSVWKSSDTLAGQSLEFDATSGQLVIVPEPGGFAIAGIGMAFIGWSAWRSRRATRARPLS